MRAANVLFFFLFLALLVLACGSTYGLFRALSQEPFVHWTPRADASKNHVCRPDPTHGSYCMFGNPH